MRICKIWDSEYPWDVRTAKVCGALTDAGHEVSLVARNRDRRAVTERLPEAHVHRLRPARIPALNSALQFPAFFNPVWVRHIGRTVASTNAQMILVRDLPLAPTAIHIGRGARLPVVLDMAENYPAMMAAIFSKGVARPRDWIIRNPAIVKRVERWVLDRIDHVLVVVEESGERLVRLGFPPDRITLVSNTPSVRRVTCRSVGDALEGAALRLVYLGLLEAPRGIGVLLRGVAESVRRGQKVRLTLIGSGRERESFEREAAELGLDEQVVEFLGYIPNERALQIVSEADVGVVPHHATESWNTTIPNKLFDYMAAGLPVLSSNTIPCARVVRSTEAGVVYDHDSPKSLADGIEALSSVDTRRRLGDAGQRAVRSEYCWERDTKRLLDALAKVSNGPLRFDS